MSAPTTLAELFRSLGLTLTVRAAEDEDGSWACTLTRPDGAIHEVESVTFFDVDPDTGEMTPVSTFAHAAMLVEVEVDDETGEVTITDIGSEKLKEPIILDAKGQEEFVDRYQKQINEWADETAADWYDGPDDEGPSWRPDPRVAMMEARKLK